MNYIYDIYNTIYTAFNIPLGDFWKVTLTTGKLVGYCGVVLFSGRWLIQMGASQVSGKPVLPRLFWYMSISGSICLLLYFVFGKNDSVGITQLPHLRSEIVSIFKVNRVKLSSWRSTLIPVSQPL